MAILGKNQLNTNFNTIDAAIDAEITTNGNNDITGAIMNARLKALSTFARDAFDSSLNTTDQLNDVTPSRNTVYSSAQVESLISGLSIPVIGRPEITSFEAFGQPTQVPVGTVLTNNRTFNFTLRNPSQIQGQLTLFQDRVALVTNIDPTLGTATVTINDVTLTNAGDFTQFSLSGTGVDGSGFSRNFIVTATSSEQQLYYGRSTTNNPASVVISGFTGVHIIGDGHVIETDTGTTSAGDYFIILVPTAQDITDIRDALEEPVRDLFTRTEDVRVINSVNYTSYVVGPLVANAQENFDVTIQ